MDAARRKKDGYEFLWINVNKKSVALNLKSERGVDLARQLITRADVLVENFQQGTMERFGLDYESLKTLNPRLIYACSRGYGESGPYAAYGNTAQSNNSMTGWTHTSWGYSGTPGKKALGIGDEAAGVSMCVGILAALHARERTGEGQKIVVSMQEAVLGFMISSMHEYFTGIDVGNQPIPVADGFFTLRVPEHQRSGLVQTRAFDGAKRSCPGSSFCDRGGAPPTPDRTGRADQSMGAGKTRQELWDGLRDLDYFGAPVLSTREVLEDPHVRARQAFVERDHPTAGPTTLLAPWIHLIQDAGQHPRRCAGDWPTYARGARWSFRPERGGAGGPPRAESDQVGNGVLECWSNECWLHYSNTP